MSGLGSVALAQSGTWSGTTTPLTWSDTGNWASGIIADGSGNTANFTNNIAADTTINITADQTIGNIVFGDSNTSTAGSWIIANNAVSTNNLILAGTTPTITVNALGATKTATISAIIEGTSGLTKDGTGILVLSGANTYSGGTTINGGILSVAAATNLGASADITLNGGRLQITTGNLNLARNINIGTSGGTVQSTASGIGSAVTYSGTISGAGNTLTVIGADNSSNRYSDFTGSVSLGTMALSGTSSSVGLRNTATITNAISVGASQTLHLNGLDGVNASTSTYSGFDITLNGGALRNRMGGNTIDRSISLTANSTIINRAGNANHLTINSGKLNLGSRTLTIQSDATSEYISILGGITGDATSSIVMSRVGTATEFGQLRLGGTNSSFSGSLAITVGEVRIDSATALSANNAVAFTSNVNNKTLTLNGNNLTVGGLSTGATVGNAIVQNGSGNANGATLNVSVSSGSQTFGGVMRDGESSGSLGLTKSGSGRLTLSGINTHTGITSISGGTLALSVSGSMANSSSIVIAGSSTLDITGVTAGFTLGATQSMGGTGSILATNKTFVASGTLAPGNSPGTLTQDGGTLQLGANGDYNWQITDATGVAGTGYDTVNLINGAILDLSALSTLSPYNINIWSLSSVGPDVNGLANHFNGLQDYSWTLFSTSSAIAGFNQNLFQINLAATNGTNGFLNDLNGGSFSVALSNDSTDLVLRFTAIPEASTALLGGLGALGLLRRRRK
jgi:autotransporter-associated beta strand protein